jgi:hypothetical protein
MARAITVKVATPKVINALQAKLDKINSDYANQEQFEAEYQAEIKAWNTALFEYAKSKIDTATNLRTNYRTYNNTLNIDFDVLTNGTDFPKQPERNFEQIAQYQYKEAVEEITNALSILKMTDEETVNASTMKSIAKYL